MNNNDWVLLLYLFIYFNKLKAISRIECFACTSSTNNKTGRDMSDSENSVVYLKNIYI